MNTRALLVVGSLLALPAWSQEPAAEASGEPPRTFDLNSEQVKKIMRDAAATQYAAPLQDEAVPASQPDAQKSVRFVPPEQPPARKAGKLSLPPMPKEVESSFLSHVISSLIDEALGIEPGDPLERNSVSWLTCQSNIDLKRETLGNGSCNR